MEHFQRDTEQHAFFSVTGAPEPCLRIVGIDNQ